jgi:hypothetical protein
MWGCQEQQDWHDSNQQIDTNITLYAADQGSPAHMLPACMVPMSNMATGCNCGSRCQCDARHAALSVKLDKKSINCANLQQQINQWTQCYWSAAERCFITHLHIAAVVTVLTSAGVAFDRHFDGPPVNWFACPVPPHAIPAHKQQQRWGRQQQQQKWQQQDVQGH